jgi:hypothetical protein
MSTGEKIVNRSVFVVVLLVIASVAADTAVCVMARDQLFPAPAWILMFALAFSQISLLALFVALGSAVWLERFAALGGGIAAWVWMLEATTGASPDELTTAFALQAAAIVVPASLGRLAGLRWTDERTEVRDPRDIPRRRQLTLAHLFGWTTLAAITAALASHASLPVWVARAFFAWLLANNALSALAAAWATFSERNAPWYMASAIVMVSLAGLLLEELFPSYQQGPLVTLNVFQLLLVATTLAICRSAGLRIIRLSS